MSLKVYGNDLTKNIVSQMIIKNREPHSIVIHGEQGLGKKALAKWIGAALMCETHSGTPCGHCKSCLMINHDNHPDFITVKANENGNYKVDESVRPMVADAVVLPNEGKFKVYLVADIDKSKQTLVQIQNILLKLIEEPPDHVIVILTANSKEVFLPTIISRVLCLGVSPNTNENCRNYLEEQGKYTLEQINEAVNSSGGNIGRCVEYLEGKTLAKSVEIARAVTDAVIANDEYGILKALFAVDGKKQSFLEVIMLLEEIARDACLNRIGGGVPISCYKDGAVRLSNILQINQSEELYSTFAEFSRRTEANCNLTLTINSLAGQICELL